MTTSVDFLALVELSGTDSMAQQCYNQYRTWCEETGVDMATVKTLAPEAPQETMEVATKGAITQCGVAEIRDVISVDRIHGLCFLYYATLKNFDGFSPASAEDYARRAIFRSPKMTFTVWKALDLLYGTDNLRKDGRGRKLAIYCGSPLEQMYVPRLLGGPIFTHMGPPYSTPALTCL